MSKNGDNIKKYLNIAKGQLEGINKMIDEGRDNLEISDQISASIALLKKSNSLILKKHLHECLNDALKDGKEKKIEEIMIALDKQI